MKSRPMLGSTGSMMMSSEPAIAAVAVARPKASVLMRVGLDAHQAQRHRILRDRLDRPAGEARVRN